MPYSFHSHSGQFCHHGYGKLKDVVMEAQRKGFRVYGLSEHMPRFSLEHMYPEEMEAGSNPDKLIKMFDDYVTCARQLQQEFTTPEILVGTELEFIDPGYAQFIPAYRNRLDYLVGSLHHVNGIPIDFSPELYHRALSQVGQGDLVRLFAAYFTEQHSMLVQTQPNVVAHFDLIRIFADQKEALGALEHPTVMAQIRSNVEFAVSQGMLFEINSRAWKKGLSDAYPHRVIVKLIQELDGKFTLSDDCHGPQDVGMHYDALREFLQTCGIDTVHYLTKQDGKVTVCAHPHILDDPFWENMKQW